LSSQSLRLLSSVHGDKPLERFGEEKDIGGSLGLRSARPLGPRATSAKCRSRERSSAEGEGWTNLHPSTCTPGVSGGNLEIRRAALDSTVGAGMSQRETEHLRVLIANERKDRLALVAPIVAALGHEVIAREIEVEDVGEVTTRERPDVALVGLGESSEHALQLVEKIVHEATCPVIALIHAPDPDFVKEASKRGVFAYITDAEVKDWQSSIDIVLRRFTEYHDLEGAFGRRAVAERAKGILMERHSIDEPAAFEMLREHARSTNRKLVDVASAVVDGHTLLPKQPHAPRRLTGRADRATGLGF
jgi:AmiR/NasT family two-component response regulator